MALHKTLSLKAVFAVVAMVLTRNNHLIWYLGVGFQHLGSVIEGRRVRLGEGVDKDSVSGRDADEHNLNCSMQYRNVENVCARVFDMSFNHSGFERHLFSIREMSKRP